MYVHTHIYSFAFNVSLCTAYSIGSYYFFPYILISIFSSLILWISEILVSKCTFYNDSIFVLLVQCYFKILFIFLTLFGLWIGSFQLHSLLACHWFDILLVIILQITTWILDLTNLIISRYLSPFLVCLEDTRTLISLIFFSTLSYITLSYTIFII